MRRGLLLCVWMALAVALPPETPATVGMPFSAGVEAIVPSPPEGVEAPGSRGSHANGESTEAESGWQTHVNMASNRLRLDAETRRPEATEDSPIARDRDGEISRADIHFARKQRLFDVTFSDGQGIPTSSVYRVDMGASDASAGLKSDRAHDRTP